MFALVTDIARYPEFLPWVIALRLRSDSETEAVADMIVGFKGLRESFSCRAAQPQQHDLEVHYLDGPMRHLDDEWHFTPVDGWGCPSDFLVAFSFTNHLIATQAGHLSIE